MHKWISIHYLRGFAACAVVIHHIPKYLINHGIDSTRLWEFNLGGAGVDIFFVISGFVMYQSTKKMTGYKDAIDFFVRRLIRVIPMYWLVTLLLASTVAFMPGLFSTLTVNSETVTKSLFFYPYFNSAGLMRPIIAQGWSLNFEIFFYLLLSVVLCFRLRNHMIFTAMSLSAISLTIGILNSHIEHTALCILSPIVIEFCFGIIVAQFLTSGIEKFSHKMLLGFTLLLLSIYLFYQSTNSEIDNLGFSRLFSWGFPAMFLVLSCLLFELEKSSRESKLLLLLGDASYSIYLTHGLVFSVIWKMGVDAIDNLFVVSFMFLICPILIGCLIHLTIEKYITDKLNMRWNSSKLELLNKA